MDPRFLLLPIVLLPFISAAMLKFAAHLYRRSTIRWRHALPFFLIVQVISFLMSPVGWLLGPIENAIIGGVVGVALYLAIAGWYLGPRVMSPTSEAIAFKGGALVGVMALVFTGAVGWLFLQGAQALLGHSRF